MLSVRKDIIYNFAHQFNIPYFLDTTPDWSCRGKMRRNIFPECIDCYTDKYKDNLLKIGKESDDLNIIINKNAVFDKNIEIELNDYGLASSAFNSIKETRQKKYAAKSIGTKIKVKAISEKLKTILL